MNAVQHDWVKHRIVLAEAVLAMKPESQRRVYTPHQLRQKLWLLGKYREAYHALCGSLTMDPDIQIVADYLIEYANIHIAHWLGGSEVFQARMSASNDRRDQRLRDLRLHRVEDIKPEKARKGNTMLHIDTENKLNLTAQNFADGHIGVVGSTGSGKSNTTALLIELLLEHMPFAIVDIEGEYRGLRNKFDNILIIGESDHCDLAVPIAQVEALARFSYNHQVSVILDFSHYRQLDNEPLYAWLDVFMQTLWRMAFDGKKPYKIVVEEAGEWIPQNGSSPINDVMAKISSRGRKRGLTFLFTSQRFQQVSKTVVDQVELLFVHRTTKHNSLEACVNNMPTLGDTKRSMSDTIRGLEDGQVIVVKGDTREVAQIRLRETPHGGETPQIGDDTPVAIELLPVDPSLIAKLKATIKIRKPDETLSTTGQQAVRVVELESEIAHLKTENKKLTEDRDALQKQADTRALKERTLTAERDRARGEVNGLIETNRDVYTLLKAIMEKFADNESLVESLDEPTSATYLASTKKAYTATVDSSAEPNPATDEVYRSPAQIKYAIGRQKSAFDRLMRSIGSAGNHHQSLLTLLANNESRRFTVEQIAREIGYAVTTIKGAPPILLLDRGILCREYSSQKREYVYWSNVTSYLQAEYADLDQMELFQQLVGE